MGRYIGVDIRSTHVRAALVRTGGRQVTIERMLEVDRAHTTTLVEALRAVVSPMLQHGEPIVLAVDGDRAFIHWLTLPASALRQLDDVLPFEIEAQVPVDIEELVFDYRTQASGREEIKLMTAAARVDHVRERIQLVREALGCEPDRIGCGPLPLVNVLPLIQDLDAERPAAIVDLGAGYSEVLVVHRGEVIFARTLSRGLEALPAGANALAAELRQTLAAAAVRSGQQVERVELVGHAATDANAGPYLKYMLGVDVSPLDELAVAGIVEGERPLVARFAKAIALALSLGGRARDLDLRQGALKQQRGFMFLKEKAPVLSGLAAAIMISFFFATWAEMRTLNKEREVVEAALEQVSERMLGEATRDPTIVESILDRTGHGDVPDPMPHADAFDVFVELSKGIPMEITHDIEELDLKRGQVRLNGVVKSKKDAQSVGDILQKWDCAKNVKIAKITQAVGSENQKYKLDFDLQCSEDAPKKERAKSEKSESKPPAEEEEALQ